VLVNVLVRGPHHNFLIYALRFPTLLFTKTDHMTTPGKWIQTGFVYGISCDRGSTGKGLYRYIYIAYFGKSLPSLSSCAL
jgi:hypothetical protein